MKRQLFYAILSSVLIVGCESKKSQSTSEEETNKPNVIIIYVDDLGYGDVGAYGATLVKTPNIDKMAANGVKFTDAHCSASTCTPSRYSLLTGSFAFRANAGILPGDAPLLIDTSTPTLATMFKGQGYKTAVVGKWHLGLGDGQVDWNTEVKPGPLEIGFDYSFLIPATGDRVPTVYLENHHVVNLDKNDPITVNYRRKIENGIVTGEENPELLRYKADGQHNETIINGVSRIGFMKGGESAWWVDEDFPDILTLKSKNFIKENKDNPFFLFLSYHDIHVPRLPNDQFLGASDMGLRGDVIAQMDWCTGEVINYLEEMGIAENTLVIFSSDNGPVLNDGYFDNSVEDLAGHKPSGPFRGGKYSAFEAGTRVPTIAYWPSVIKPLESNALWSQTDIYASLAGILGHNLDPKEAPDSFDVSKTLLGEDLKGRDFILEEAYTLSLRKGNWKYIAEREKVNGFGWIEGKGIESGLSIEKQLYNLSDDISEEHNLANQYPELIKELDSLIMIIKESPIRKHVQ